MHKLSKQIVIGKRVKISSLGANGDVVGGEGRKKNPIFKGTVVGVYCDFFNVDNGKWQESFKYSDIGTQGGIQVKYL